MINLENYVFDNAKYVIGRGSIEYLSSIKKNRIALVIDSLALGDTLSRIKSMLKNSQVICDVKGEPCIEDLESPINRIRDLKPDCIVAVGGGSVIDTAKAIWLSYEHPQITWEDAFKPYTLPPMGKLASLITVPTTSGTGAETTCVAVLIDKKTLQKRLIMSRELIPDVAILDSNLSDTMPSSVAAYSGMDALAHALEAAICKISSPMVVSLAVTAVLDILDWLPVSVLEKAGTSNFTKARESMHIAASMAGMAINNSCAGLSHAMDQPGAVFNIPHGLVCGILLPYTINFFIPNPTYSLIAKRLGYSGDDLELGRQLISQLTELNRKIGIPACFKDLGINEVEYISKLDHFINSALSGGAIKFSPVHPDKVQLRSLFLEAYYGNNLQ